MATATIRKDEARNEQQAIEIQVERSSGATPPARRATGPRTLRGKKKSSRNAVKDGIFSAVLLRRESRVEYEALVRGLHDHFRPEGTLEESLVEKLAMLLWRHRRLLQAEAAEIAKVSEFVLGDRLIERAFKAVETEEDSGFVKGMLHQCTNPDVFEMVITHLKDLRGSIEENGFDFEGDSKVLRKIYGPLSSDSLRGNLFLRYTLIAYACGRLAEDASEGPKYSEAEGRQRAIKRIDEEIKSLEELREVCEETETKRDSYEATAALVPPEGILDRLLRYEASLDRAFDRTLTQLERLQRMRLGQPIPPPVRVEVVR